MEKEFILTIVTEQTCSAAKCSLIYLNLNSFHFGALFLLDMIRFVSEVDVKARVRPRVGKKTAVKLINR